MESLPAFDLSPARPVQLTVCARPFRAAGPRIEAEEIAGKPVVHAYGHGGAGWSLSWGTAEAVLALIAPKAPAAIAVIGAGAIGLTVASVLGEAGFEVRILAQDLPEETRSARATGSWSPSSRVAGIEAGGTFAARWEALARSSFARHRQLMDGAAGPVSLSSRYRLGPDAPKSRRFVELEERIEDIVPPARALDGGPDGAPEARLAERMTFDVPAYTAFLAEGLRRRGTRIERRRFSSPREWAGLPEAVVVNATGLGAGTLMGDDSLVPIRGQVARLAPQGTLRHGVTVGRYQVLGRPDAVIVQDRGTDESGYGVAEEVPDDEEFRRCVEALTAAGRFCRA